MGSEKVDWAINGELALNCNCTVFCPCAVSLGDHPPTCLLYTSDAADE